MSIIMANFCASNLTVNKNFKMISTKRQLHKVQYMLLTQYGMFVHHICATIKKVNGTVYHWPNLYCVIRESGNPPKITTV